jgi:hypothetical protein
MSFERLMTPFLFFSLFTSSAFGFGYEKMAGVGKVELPGVVAITADWVKAKESKYDVSFQFKALSNKTVLFFVGDMKCKRGAEASGNINIHSDRRTIDLRPGETRTIILTCELAIKTTGDFYVSAKLFDNPNGDANTPGKVLAEKLEWKQGEHEGAVLN